MRSRARQIALFGMLGAMMYVLKLLMQWLPNIHLLGVFIVTLTVVFRWKALYPIYVYVLLDGIVGGFGIWWIPYTYIWTLLWGAVMLLPKNMPSRAAGLVYPLVSALHGLLFGILYAPFQAIAFGLGFEGTLAWIISGLPFDVTHCVSNFVCGLLILPLVRVLRRAVRS